MPGFNTIPGSAGGGGAGALNYVASVHMSTFNRSWAQAGVAGNYGIYSQNQENGYAYFVGTGTTTGVSLNRMINVSHSFTRIDIIAPQNDIISLYKVKVKATSAFNNRHQVQKNVFLVSDCRKMKMEKLDYAAIISYTIT